MVRIDDSFDYIRINLASPERIKHWTQHPNDADMNINDTEVLTGETMNYRTLKPEMDGLFCERIFGPTKNWECHCGQYKYRRSPQKVIVCEICGVEITEARVRRHRMGYIDLEYPVAHIWYVKGLPSYIAIILGTKRRYINKIVYFVDKEFEKDENLTSLIDKVYGFKKPREGAELLFDLLQGLDLRKSANACRAAYPFITSDIKKRSILRRIRILESFIATGTNPTWMLLPLIPVLPPALRPMLPLEGGRYATSDLNELYRRVISRNIRLQRLYGAFAPDMIIRNEKRMLQEAVDALIDNGRREKQAVGLNSRPLRCLSDVLAGKQGRFRQNLLGKRVDYSGRSVIIVGPELKLNQCGLPYEMACELFKPFLLHELLSQGYASNIKIGKQLIRDGDSLVWDILKNLLIGFPIFLNRAPTLHRLGIQAFEPIIVTGRAIKLHPLVCPAFNADFDGDQMAVHIPLSLMSQTEAYLLMLSPNNFISPATGEPIILPSQDMVLGMHYLTSPRQLGRGGNHNYFSNEEDVILAYNCGKVDLHAAIWLRSMSQPDNLDGSFLLNTLILPDFSVLYKFNDQQIRRSCSGEVLVKYILTTPGRVLFNDLIYSSLI